MGGDFTGQPLIYDPTTQTIGHDVNGNPYPIRKSFLSEYGTNAVPATMFDKVAANFQKFYPTPTNHIAGGNFIPGTTNGQGIVQNNFYSSLPQSTPYRKYFGRFDYDINPRNRVTASIQQSDLSNARAETSTTITLRFRMFGRLILSSLTRRVSATPIKGTSTPILHSERAMPRSSAGSSPKLTIFQPSNLSRTILTPGSSPPRTRFTKSMSLTPPTW